MIKCLVQHKSRKRALKPSTPPSCRRQNLWKTVLGFRGRTAIHELLDLSDHIREMILDKQPTSEIKRVAREEGMMFLRESALAKAKAAVTTLREINKVTFIE